MTTDIEQPAVRALKRLAIGATAIGALAIGAGAIGASPSVH
jgi:hypothetical protein